MSRIDRVIVTGASSGIGFDIAKRFLEAGSRVLLNARDEAKLLRATESLAAHRDRLWCVPGAIGAHGTAARLAEAARRHMGGLDVLVNNAGIFGLKSFLDSTSEELEAFFTTNVKGTFLVTQALVPLLIQAGGGSIINIGTVLTEQPTVALPCAAAMTSKGAVHALTRSLAVELAPHAADRRRSRLAGRHPSAKTCG
jgi:NAD(P)-dependent dehydrogenase (short-subunit alcohol dehydrogenase family)